MSTDEDDVLVERALQLLAKRLRRETTLDSPDTVRNFLTIKLSPYEYESFQVVFLDTRHRVIDVVEMFRGTIDGATVHPREIVKAALRLNAAAVILAHNHPSGVAEPSQADHAITTRIKDALSLVDIRVLDHFVVSGGTYVSLAERGFL